MKAFMHLIFSESKEHSGKKEKFVAHLWREVTVPEVPKDGSTIQLSFREDGDEVDVPVIKVDWFFEHNNGTLLPIIRVRYHTDDAGDVETNLEDWKKDRERMYQETEQEFLMQTMGFKLPTDKTKDGLLLNLTGLAGKY